MSGILVVLNIF